MARTRTPKLEAVKTEEETPKVIRPNELAKELGLKDGKRLRAFLRQEFTRPAEAKNSNWELTPDMIAAARERFAPKNDKSE